MPHYLIRMNATPGAVEQIRAKPRVCMKAVHRATSELGGHLDGCWFTEDAGSVIALLSVPRHLDITVLRDAYAGILEGLEVDVESLLTLHEVDGRPRDIGVRVRNELWSDPVDLSSDLSFPASDPPGWIKRDVIPAEDPS